MQPDRRLAAAQWRSAAAEDLRVSRLLGTESPSIAASHAQQAAFNFVDGLISAEFGD